MVAGEGAPPALEPQPTAAAEAAPLATGEAAGLHPSQAYRAKIIARAQIHNAVYNPRVISAAAKKKLKVGLQKLGLLQPLVWNQRSGNLVGGHQRLEILDKLANGKEGYQLEVAAVDLNHAQEVEANILLNNPETHGEWDLEKLDQAMRTEGLRLDATGFDMGDIFQVLGESPFTVEHATEVAELADKHRSTTEAIDSVTASLSENRDDHDFYVVVVFKDPQERSEFLAKLELPDNAFQDGRSLQKRLLEGPAAAAAHDDEDADADAAEE